MGRGAQRKMGHPSSCFTSIYMISSMDVSRVSRGCQPVNSQGAGHQRGSPLRRRVRARWPRPRRWGPVEALCVAELSRVAGSSLFLRVALRALAGGGGESCSKLTLPQ